MAKKDRQAQRHRELVKFERELRRRRRKEAKRQIPVAPAGSDGSARVNIHPAVYADSVAEELERL